MCKQIAHSVQKQSENKKKHKTVLHLKEDKDIENLAKLIDSKGKRPTKMPDIACKPNEIISVVDSGSVEIVADAKKTFPAHTVTPSKASEKGVAYVSASNTIMPNRGEVTVDLTAGNGVKLEGVKWQDAPVNMPILSVRKVARKGARVTFWDDGGVIKLPNGDKIPFYHAQGVYFVKFIVDPPKGSNIPPFGGPGN